MGVNLEIDISGVSGGRGLEKFAAWLRDVAPVGPATAARYHYVVRELLGKSTIFSLDQAVRFVKKKNRIYVRAAIMKFAEFLQDAGAISDVELVACSAKLPKPQEAPPKPRDIPKVDALLEIVKAMDPDDREIALFMFYTGCRVHEALDVKLQDIDFKSGRALIFGKGRLEKKPRPAKIPIDFAGKIEKRAMMLGLLPGERIFWPNSKASLESRRRMFNARLEAAAVKVAGEPLRGSHNFRRVVACELLERTGRDLQLVQRILGHSKIDTTQKYTQFVDREKDLDTAREIMTNIGASEGSPQARQRPKA